MDCWIRLQEQRHNIIVLRDTYLRQGLSRYDVLRCGDVLRHDVLGHDVLGPHVLGQDDDVHHAGLQGRQLKR